VTTTHTSTVRKSALPTKKWWTATITGAAGLLVMLLTGDRTITDPEIVALITFAVQRGIAWLVPNDRTPSGDGVPAKS
jgi:hypothetical protein